MKILQRYIAKTIISVTLVIIAILVGIETFILFVNQMGDIGKGDFGVWQAFLFVLMELPTQIYLFFPLACLLGCLIGLGLLASRSELTVMRTSGMSVKKIVVAVLVSASVLIVFMFAFGEMVAPKLEYQAYNRKAIETTGGQALRTSRGIWVRDGMSFIHIDKLSANGRISGVSRYLFNKKHKLISAMQAKEGVFQHGRWVLNDVTQSSIHSDKVTARYWPRRIWLMNINPSLLAVTAVDPDEMSIFKLHSYLEEQQANQTNGGTYALAFWQRLFRPITTCVMMLLAIPFIFGSLRSSTMGARLMTGILLGFGFYILNKFFGPVSLVYQLPPVTAAVVPTLLFAGLGLFLLARVR